MRKSIAEEGPEDSRYFRILGKYLEEEGILDLILGRNRSKTREAWFWIKCLRDEDS